ncbi:MAG: DoxX family protein [Proteobacteria bacterium]|nr:DoxX family protein [Pseudomonadota bacterium]
MDNPLLAKSLVLMGRLLLGLYFLVHGISKITGFDATATYMTTHGMMGVPFFLVLTIVLQVGGGVLVIIGRWLKPTAFVLAGLVLVISVMMHDFWNVYEGVDQGHETQNFIKNLAIMAGLMVLAGADTSTRWRDLFKRA